MARKIHVTSARRRVINLLKQGDCTLAGIIAKAQVTRDVVDGLRRIGAVACEALPPDGQRGRPRLAVSLVTDILPDDVPITREKRPRPSPFQDRILLTIGQQEMTGGQIARLLDLPHENISTTLASMCASGKLVRRRMGGQVAGKTQVRDFYLYRRA